MKTIVITGASRGLGLAASKRFLNEGWRVIGTYNKNKVPIESANFEPVQMDLSDSKSISQATNQIYKLAKSVEVLVNNAGIILDGHDTTLSVDIIRKTFEVDVIGIIDFTNKVESLLDNGSHIINMDTTYGAFSTPIDDETSAGYRISKAALNMYSRILAFNLQSKGVIVSSLDPGWVRTEMGWDVADETYKPNREPEDVADDILKIVLNVKETGCFWRFGKKREW